MLGRISRSRKIASVGDKSWYRQLVESDLPTLPSCYPFPAKAVIRRACDPARSHAAARRKLTLLSPATSAAFRYRYWSATTAMPSTCCHTTICGATFTQPPQHWEQLLPLLHICSFIKTVNYVSTWTEGFKNVGCLRTTYIIKTFMK